MGADLRAQPADRRILATARTAVTPAAPATPAALRGCVGSRVRTRAARALARSRRDWGLRPLKVRGTFTRANAVAGSLKSTTESRRACRSSVST